MILIRFSTQLNGFKCFSRRLSDLGKPDECIQRGNQEFWVVVVVISHCNSISVAYINLDITKMCDMFSVRCSAEHTKCEDFHCVNCVHYVCTRQLTLRFLWCERDPFKNFLLQFHAGSLIISERLTRLKGDGMHHIGRLVLCMGVCNLYSPYLNDILSSGQLKYIWIILVKSVILFGLPNGISALLNWRPADYSWIYKKCIKEIFVTICVPFFM